jgi:hypothetical protein
MKTDLTRDRKVRVTLHAVWSLFLGLVACLGVIAYKHEVGLVLSGLYVPFATGVGAALGLFINGNVKVHQAQSEPKP